MATTACSTLCFPQPPRRALKRGPNDLLPIANGGILVMTADTDAKKAKLDSSVGAVSAAGAPPPPCFAPSATIVPSSQTQSSSATIFPHIPSGQLMATLTAGAAAIPNLNGLTDPSQITATNVAVPAPKSKVVHLRNIPSDFTDLELLQFCLPFGNIVNYLLLKGKNQAFVEYGLLDEAQRIVIATEAYPVAIRGRTMFVQYSTHQELKTDRSPPSQPPATAVDETNLLVLSNGGSSTGNGTSGVTSASQLDISGSGTQQQPNAVLRVIIENMICPVTLDLLHSIFSRFGKVLRIITFNKNNTFQALIQLSEANAAQHARDTLNGHQVYSGCCTLRIDYSKLATLNVKYNNDKSRDYTNPNLPSGELTLEQQLSLVTAAAAGQLPASLGSIVPSPFAFPFGAPPAAQYAVPQHTIQANDAALSGAALGPLLSTSATANAANHAALNVAAGLRFPPVSAILTISPVILVSNLDETKVTPDALFTLFGVYGDVQRVKILFNKKDNALIQYAEPQQAQLAIQHLDKIRWHEKTVRVAPSKHTNVQMPKEGQPDAGLTRDYSQSPLHRFKKPGSKNYMNIYPPSCTLHLSNIPPNITEEFLMQAFEEREFAVKGFKFFPKDHKMALVQLEDVETAINALIEMHNFKLAENAHLRVSFSKSGI